MGDCGCEKAKKDLEEYLHNELCSEEAADIREHMENCIDCSEEYQVGVVLTEAVRRACDEFANDGLKELIKLKIISLQQSE